MSPSNPKLDDTLRAIKANVDKVKAVASPQAELLGREIKVRALIPVNDINIKDPKNIKRVAGVGVSGIVDLKL